LQGRSTYLAGFAGIFLYEPAEEDFRMIIYDDAVERIASSGWKNGIPPRNDKIFVNVITLILPDT
jgi:hypothetical protein